MNHIFHCHEPPVYPITYARELRSASRVASPSHATSIDGPSTSHNPHPSTPMSVGPATRRGAGSVTSISAVTLLQEDKARVIAEIEMLERLAAARRPQDLEDLRKVLSENDGIEVAAERQRHQLSHAAKERFMVAEGARLTRLQEL